MDISSHINTFSHLLKCIHIAFNSKEHLGATYAKMYNLAHTVIKQRIEYEKKHQPKEKFSNFETKIAYESYKIAANMMTATKKLKLSKKVVNQNITDNILLQQYLIVTASKKETFRKMAQERYKNDITKFNNENLIKYVRRTFLFSKTSFLPMLPFRRTPKLLTAGSSGNYSSKILIPKKLGKISEESKKLLQTKE